MKLATLLLALGLFALVGCDRPSPPVAVARPSEATRPEVAPPPTPVSTTDPTPPPPAPPAPGKNAEPLPEAPKTDPRNEHRPLNQEKTLLLELAPDPANPSKKKPVRVLLTAEVCLQEGVLEVLLCRKNTKEHEAIIRTDLDAKFLHAALIALGLKPGSPVQFVNPQTGEEDYKPASGDPVKVSVHYRKDGQLHTHPAQEWIRDLRTKKPMTHQWVFAGSRFLKNPDRPDDPPYYCANNGEVIAISNFVDSMLDLPVAVSRDNAALNFEAMTGKIPPLLSKVWVILEPGAKK